MENSVNLTEKGIERRDDAVPGPKTTKNVGDAGTILSLEEALPEEMAPDQEPPAIPQPNLHHEERAQQQDQLKKAASSSSSSSSSSSVSSSSSSVSSSSSSPASVIKQADNMSRSLLGHNLKPAKLKKDSKIPASNRGNFFIILIPG